MTDANQIAVVPEIEIRSTKGLVPLNLHELWEYRELIYFLLWRDLKGRYRQMALGPLWIVIQPLLNVLIFTMIFGMVARLPTDGVPYPVFNYAALLPWTFFANVAVITANSLLSYRDLISKVYFPRLVIPLVSMLSGLVDLAISFVILLGMMACYGYLPGWSILALPIYLALAAASALAVGLWTASWVAHYHDVINILQIAVRGWMYVSPVVYAVSMVPAAWRSLYMLNPLAQVIEGFRWSLLGKGTPPGTGLAVSFAIVLPVLVSGAYYFRRTERNIVDVA